MYLCARDTLKFGITVGFAAIFFDASIAHGLFWENDPYWTYWVTKTFLIISVFAFGTAFLGIGIRQGLLVTAAHTLVLEVHYQWFAPVGLPQEPEWLDFNHVWITGVPAHYLSILAGYLFALWMWRRRLDAARASLPSPDSEVDGRPTALLAASGAVLLVLLDGALSQGLVQRHFPGLTFFLERLLIAFVFVFAWAVFVRFDVAGWLVGSLMLGLAWTTYSMYLGPQGLPTHTPSYLGYKDLWFKEFPGGVLAALLGLALTTWALRPRLLRWTSNFRTHEVRGSVQHLLLLGAFAALAAASPPTNAAEGLSASASAQGSAMMVVGPNPVDMDSTQPANGSIEISVVDLGNRWSHVQNTDVMDVIARFSADGSRYEVHIDKAMPRHPLGRYTTWSGVAYNHEMHGDTGIGTNKLPKMKPEIALYGWASVSRDGAVISKMAPAHVMVTTKGSMRGVMLEVDTEEKTLPGLPNGYLTVMWHEIRALTMPTTEIRVRQAIGWLAMVLVVAVFWILAAREGKRTARRVIAAN
jgi:hypothetical protein